MGTEERHLGLGALGALRQGVSLVTLQSKGAENKKWGLGGSTWGQEAAGQMEPQKGEPDMGLQASGHGSLQEWPHFPGKLLSMCPSGCSPKIQGKGCLWKYPRVIPSAATFFRSKGSTHLIEDTIICDGLKNKDGTPPEMEMRPPRVRAAAPSAVHGAPATTLRRCREAAVGCGSHSLHSHRGCSLCFCL